MMCNSIRGKVCDHRTLSIDAVLKISTVQDATCIRRAGSVVVVPIKRRNDRPVPETGIIVITQRISRLLTIQELGERTQPIRPTKTVSTPDRIQRQDTVIQPHTDELIRSIGGVISILFLRILRPVSMNRSRRGRRTTDLFRN